MIQSLLDGILVGAIYSLGAIGLTMVMHMLRFANFSHAELLSVGAYCALVFDRLFEGLLPVIANNIGPLSLTWALLLAMLVSMGVTGLTAMAIDRLIFRRVRERGVPQSMVFASFPSVVKRYRKWRASCTTNAACGVAAHVTAGWAAPLASDVLLDA